MHNRKASNALCMLVERKKEKFSGPGENCQRNVTDLTGSLVMSSRPPGRLQKRSNDRTWNAGVAVRTADGNWRTADAADEQCLRCGRSSPSCTVVLCDNKVTASYSEDPLIEGSAGVIIQVRFRLNGL